MRPPFQLCTTARHLAALLVIAATPASAALYDEIQVYTDDINAAGVFGLELHLNTTPDGRSTPDYPGESTPEHGWRATAEFSYGLPNDLEAGLYLPTLFEPGGQYELAGVKLRLKWLPIHPEEDKAGWYFGANDELGRLKPQYDPSRWNEEFKLIGGYHAPEWLVGGNITPSWPLSEDFRNAAPDLELSLKASHKIAKGIDLGFEYYADMGATSHLAAFNQQDHTLFLAIDVDRKPFVFNFGIGRGLTSGADAWTVKAIIEVPF